ncbi:hypothetical protein RI367_004536 [Sorochytrium milnesiophthora]
MSPDIATTAAAVDSPPFVTMANGRFLVASRKILGKGTFGIVYLGMEQPTRRLVAVKVEQRTTSTAELTIEHEVDMHRKLPPHGASDVCRVVPILHSEWHPTYGMIVLPFFLATLSSLLNRGLHVDSALLIDVFLQLVRSFDFSLSVFPLLTVPLDQSNSLAALHMVGIVHCDVKPENILLKEDCTPYFNDFGLATVGPEKGSRCTGTYQSPRVASNDYVDMLDDWWAIGMTFLELCLPSRHLDWQSPQYAEQVFEIYHQSSVSLISTVEDFRLRTVLEHFFELWCEAKLEQKAFPVARWTQALCDMLGGETLLLPAYRAKLHKSVMQSVRDDSVAEFDGATACAATSSFNDVLDKLYPRPESWPADSTVVGKLGHAMASSDTINGDDDSTATNASGSSRMNGLVDSLESLSTLHGSLPSLLDGGQQHSKKHSGGRKRRNKQRGAKTRRN